MTPREPKPAKTKAPTTKKKTGTRKQPRDALLSTIMGVVREARSMGALHVEVSSGQVTVGVSFIEKKLVELQPAMGFQLDAEEEYDDEEDGADPMEAK